MGEEGGDEGSEGESGCKSGVEGGGKDDVQTRMSAH